MTINDLVPLAKLGKEMRVEDGERGDRAAAVTFFRDGADVAMAVCPNVQKALFAIWTGVHGFAADAICCEYDTHAGPDVNPLTGRSWAPGEMQAEADRGAEDAGILTSTLVLVRRDRDGNEDVAMLPYRTEGKRVIWQHDPTIASGQDTAGFQGRIFDVPRRAFQPAGPLMQMLENQLEAAADRAGLPVEDRRHHRDAGTLALLTSSGLRVYTTLERMATEPPIGYAAHVVRRPPDRRGAK